MADYRKIRAQTWRSWLQGLPEEIYDKRDTAHIVRLLDVLCSESGVGGVRKRALLKRLQTSLYETRYGDLDTVYSQIFALPRLKSEQYAYSESALLLWSEIQEMNAKDAKYRQRIWWYMLSFQYGGTVEGLRLAAQAATGIKCSVVDGCVYYRSAGIRESQQGDMSGEPLNYDESIDFNGVTILVEQDEELTAEQLYNLSTVTARLRPVDVHYTFMSRRELMSRLVFADVDDEIVKPISAECSSRWWNVVRMVTGRPDWGAPTRDDEWIEANVTKEAPQQLLSAEQESEYDFTCMTVSINASSEHVGYYNASQRSIFKSLAAKGAEVSKGALNALSRASSKSVSYGYYGDSLTIDGSYPESYKSQILPFFSEEGRSSRFWSSDEREGSESLEIELKRLVPVNRISFTLFRKPIRVSVYFSSYKNEDGTREWVQAKDADNRPMTFTYREWSNASGDETVAIDFDCRCVKCDAIRMEFERLDIPYYRKSWDGTYVADYFPWSIECADVSVRYIIKYEEDFVPATYEDMFGNRVDTKLRTMDGEYAIDGDALTYWVSQPDVGESAVEYLILKIADEPTRINFIDIDAIYSGCQMNVYSTDAAEPGYWTPYPQVYTLQSGRVELPLRKVTYIKLEFTTLCAIPYDLSQSGVFVNTRRFSWDTRKYLEDRTTYSYEQSTTQSLLSSAQKGTYDNALPEERIGIEKIYDAGDPNDYIGENVDGGRVYFMTSATYRSYQDSVIMSYYGDDMALESTDVATPAATSYGSESIAYRFSEKGEHVYDVEQFERTDALAYVVGIRDVMFGFTSRVFLADQYGSFYIYMQDGKYIDINDGWTDVRGERVHPASDDRLNYFETLDLQSIYPFRTFEMASNQKEPVEKFEHPSDMYQEWHGCDTDVASTEMGVSGTVLVANSASPGMGIESEPKLTRSMAIGKAQVDVYPMVDGYWNFECYDLAGEFVFSLYFNLEAQKWQTVGATFVPMPGGSWWDDDYSYRVFLPLQGPLAAGACVFLPVVDIDALVSNRMIANVDIDPDLSGIRLVYFNGISVEEIPLEINDNMEMWFRLKQDVPMGKAANGRYDFYDRSLYGAYYLYISGKTTPTSGEPLRDYRDVFDSGTYELVADVSWSEVNDRTWNGLFSTEWDFDALRVTGNGTLFKRPGDRVEVENEFFLPDKGFVSFDVTLDDPMGKVAGLDGTAIGHEWVEFYDEAEPSSASTWGDVVGMDWGSVGEPDIRFLLDYKDTWKRIQCYTYETQLVFVVRDKDGYESSFVSLDENLFTPGVKSTVLLEWDRPGTAPITKAQVKFWYDIDESDWSELRSGLWDYIPRDASGRQTAEVDPNDKRRRWIGVWVDSATQRRCIPNVYDEKHYIDTDKVY